MAMVEMRERGWKFFRVWRERDLEREMSEKVDEGEGRKSMALIFPLVG